MICGFIIVPPQITMRSGESFVSVSNTSLSFIEVTSMVLGRYPDSEDSDGLCSLKYSKVFFADPFNLKRMAHQISIGSALRPTALYKRLRLLMKERLRGFGF